MKSSRLFYFWMLLLAATLLFSCEKNQKLSLRGAHPLLDSLDFEFRLLNEQGVPSTTFKEGENFVFSFLMINKSNQGFIAKKVIDDTVNFFRVYKIHANTAEVDKDVVDMGKPWKIMFCFADIGIGVPPQDTAKLEIPWNATDRKPGDPYYGARFCHLEDHPPLGAGEYRTGFLSTFYFAKGEDDFKTEEMEFNIEFEVIR